MRGIVIACPGKYEEMCFNTLYALRTKLNCRLPVEIWEVGSEISPETKAKMQQLPDVVFKNVNDYCTNPEHWKGFQIKVFALYHSRFTEAILCDADVSFYQSPEIIFNDPHYQRTGTYFFRDLDGWRFTNLSAAKPVSEKFNSLTFYNQRKAFILKMLPRRTKWFPPEWLYLYEALPPTQPVKEALQESGVVFLNKIKQRESLEYIFKLNENHAETYNYVWGDKETFWIGCCMANKEYYLNDTAGFRYNGCLTHAYKNQLFWKQK